jgi:hypothetical protein
VLGTEKAVGSIDLLLPLRNAKHERHHKGKSKGCHANAASSRMADEETPQYEESTASISSE